MKNMVFEAVGDLVVVVHNENPPADSEWDAYLAAGTRGIVVPRFLVFTLGGGPTMAQRRRVLDGLKGRPAKAAVVSENAFVRSIVFALSVFNRGVKVFAPGSISDAYVYLGISERESVKVAKVLRKLQAEMGIEASRRA